MAEPLLTLVVPVYNVAPYLPACLDSLAAQTLPPDEIIIVDDGSTDACPQILAYFAQRMSNVRIIRQDNAGLSAARNTGLDAARGKYLAFVDSDDFVEPDMYEHLIASATAGDLDMAMCNAEYHFEGRQPDTLVYSGIAPSAVTSGAQWMKEKMRHGRLLHMVWMHLYRRDFLEANRFRFIPRLIHEDVIWTTRALLAARRVRYDASPRYHYRIPVRHFSAEQQQQRLEAIIDSSIVNARAMAETAGKVDDPELRQLLRTEWVEGALSVFHKAERLPVQPRRQRYRQLRAEGFFRLLWQNAASWRQRRKIARNYLKGRLAELAG